MITNDDGIFTLNYRYAENLDYSRYSISLTSDDDSVYFLIRNTFKDRDQQPDESNWIIEYTDSKKQFFKLKNRKINKYLALSSSKDHPKLEMIEISAKDKDEHNDNDAVHWNIIYLSERGDFALFNQYDNGSYCLTLNRRDIKNQEDAVVKAELIEPDSLYRTDIHFGITNRFSELFLIPEDIEANNCLLRLPNGMAVDALFLPPSRKDDPNKETNIRRFRVSIRNTRINEFYNFEEHLGFDPLSNNLTDEQASTLDDLSSQAHNLKIVKSLNLNADNVEKQIFKQLSNAFREPEEWFFPGLAWIAQGDGEPEIFQQIEEQEIEYSSVVDELQMTLEEISNTGLNTINYFAMLVKHTEGDQSRYLLVDPDNISIEPV